MGLGLNAFARFGCELLYAIVWCVFVGFVCLCVMFVRMFVWRVCDMLCAVVWFVCVLVSMCACVFKVMCVS